jgi:hypothetical protein
MLAKTSGWKLAIILRMFAKIRRKNSYIINDEIGLLFYVFFYFYVTEDQRTFYTWDPISEARLRHLCNSQQTTCKYANNTYKYVHKRFPFVKA